MLSSQTSVDAELGIFTPCVDHLYGWLSFIGWDHWLVSFGQCPGIQHTQAPSRPFRFSHPDDAPMNLMRGVSPCPAYPLSFSGPQMGQWARQDGEEHQVPGQSN